MFERRKTSVLTEHRRIRRSMMEQRERQRRGRYLWGQTADPVPLAPLFISRQQKRRASRKGW